MIAIYAPMFLLLAVAARSSRRLLGRRDATSAPQEPDAEKNAPFECGSESTGGRHLKLSVKFYLTAILFVVFDIEAVFVYPWAIHFRDLGWSASARCSASSRSSSSRWSTSGRRGSRMGDMSSRRDPRRSRSRAASRASPRPRLDALLGWARKYSLFAYPFVTACCGMEFMALTSPRFDIARFGAEAPRFSPRQGDLLWVVGTISQRQAPGPPAHLRADDGAQVGPRLRHLRLVAAASTTTTRPSRASTKSSPSTSTSPAARRGPRRCSTG